MSPQKATPPSLLQLAFAIVAGVVVYGFVDMAKHAEIRHACDAIIELRPRYMGADRTAPDFDLPNGKGGHVKLSDYRGKVVILHFWTQTCGPCKEELPHVAKFQDLIKDRKDVALLTVSTDEGPAAIDALLRAVLGPEGAKFPIAFDPEANVVRGKYGTTLFPETWLIDPEGRIRARFDGVPRAGEACEEIWDTALLLSAIDALESPLACDVTIDPKVDPSPSKLIASCRSGGDGM